MHIFSPELEVTATGDLLMDKCYGIIANDPQPFKVTAEAGND
jgi:hypothetical protein